MYFYFPEVSLTNSSIAIAQESPLGADLRLLMERHTADMHADTPPESIHMMDAAQLAVPEVSFFVMRDTGVPVGMGAFKLIEAGHAEIKSMHVLAEVRGRGLSKQMLTHLLDEARAAGLQRLSLETGIQPTFKAARALYAKAGFEECEPFIGYKPDPNSIFMTRHF
ncbi:GNAT family N-acetyltransferase [Pseudorhodobacter wandonensis]|jgi:putative acetyltransferase|uniref:GNAT family N-acetyltransferase n=1 Tax=Pseudorhodobacter wandonensis TaxID=1120568 RepID=UPI00067B2877